MENKTDEFFSTEECNCGPFFFPNFVRCWLSQHFNCECYCHDIAYREQRKTRLEIDKEFLEATLISNPDKELKVKSYYWFIRLTSWISWYIIKVDNHFGISKWGKKVKKDGYIYEEIKCYKTTGR
jgi:hypothetical protein